jgi:hypothetical protein
MCMLIGSYWPADPRTSNCLGESGERFGGDWIGQGTATCQQTLGCLQTARDLHAITDCMLGASPAVSKESSDVARCLVQARNPAADCAPQFQACALK